MKSRAGALPLRISICCAAERASVDFYSSCLNAGGGEEAKQLAREFVKLEEGHAGRLRKLMEKEGPGWYIVLSSLLELPFRVLGIAMGRLGGLKLACSLERRGVNFYRGLLKGKHNARMNEVLERNLSEEQLQVQRLEEILRRG